MKYFKFTQIDASTGISWAIKQPISGPSWPDIPGLDLSNIINSERDKIYYVGKVDDSAQANPDNHFFELTFEEYAKELQDYVMSRINREREYIYERENEFRNSIFSKYHETASIAGIYKYEQAKELLIDETAAAPNVRAEATFRNVDVITMANRIIQNHEDFKNKEAKIAGIRGKMQDRLNGFVFDIQNPDASLEEYKSEEIIGTKIEERFENGQRTEVEIDVKVHKYSLDLSTRFNYE